MSAPLRIGLVGYGNGGRHFHAPYIAAAEGVELAAAVVRSPDRRALFEADYPGVAVCRSLTELIDAGAVDAVVITTPPATRRELVLEAIAGGVHVIGDKPLAPDAAGARELAAAASAAGVALNVFHNRRWDADIRTLAAVIASGDIGELWSLESRFDLDEPGGLDPGPHGGLLRDLGAHLVDQLLWLLGPARSVYAQVDWVEQPGGRTDVGFAVSLVHASGVRSRASASKLNRNVERELRAYGPLGSYVAHTTDAQTQAIFAGRRPLTEGAAWGYEPESAWGILRTDAGVVCVPSERGAYQDYYAQFAAATRGEAPFPVPVEEGIRTIEVLDAARVSALEGRVVEITSSERGA
jgi:predicted dehydrogenase